MSIFGKLLKGGFDLITIPVDIVKDITTLGGANTNQEVPYTIQKLKKLAEDGNEIREEIDKL